MIDEFGKGAPVDIESMFGHVYHVAYRKIL